MTGSTSARLRADRRDVWWVVLLLVISGNPSVYAIFGGSDIVFVLAAFVLAIVVATSGVNVGTRRIWFVTSVLVLIMLIQAYEFSFLPTVTILGLITRLFLAAAVLALVDDLPTAYVKAMVAISIYTLCFYVTDQLSLAFGLGFRDLFSPLEHFVGIDMDHRFSLVYTFCVLDGTYRDASFFREPGLFAGYLLLALLFLELNSHAFSRAQRRRYLVILLVALASSFSTAGYVSAPFVLAATAFRRGRSAQARRSATRAFFAIFAVSALALWVISQETDFIESKIEHQYEEFLEESQNFEIARFGAALLDIQAIQERPLFGWGLHESTKFALTPELAELAPSGGVTGWARSFGLVGLAIFVGAIWIGMRGMVGRKGLGAIYATACIVLIAQPNTFLNFPMFMALMFLPAKNGDEIVPEAERVQRAS